MKMFNPPLAPHEIDALPLAERIHATICEVEKTAELSLQETINDMTLEANELERSVDDLHEELSDLLDAIDSEDHDELERAVRFAKLAIERNTP
jgi:uncharacterized protein YlxW (UPF0749 family)